MNDSENKNPNQYLIKIGVFLILMIPLSIVFNAKDLLYFLAIVIPIIVLFWMPLAAKDVKRDPVGWTIFAFFLPPVAFIILGTIGYKPEFCQTDVFQQYNKGIEDKVKELKTKLDSNEITKEQYKKLLSEHKTELSNQFKDNYYNTLDKQSKTSLNDKLKKKGYVLEENSEVFVEVDDKCPACGAKVSNDDDNCPGCGLSL